MQQHAAHSIVQGIYIEFMVIQIVETHLSHLCVDLWQMRYYACKIIFIVIFPEWHDVLTHINQAQRTWYTLALLLSACTWKSHVCTLHRTLRIRTGIQTALKKRSCKRKNIKFLYKIVALKHHIVKRKWQAANMVYWNFHIML